MISLRVSESEYAAMHAVYPSYGARNVSEFARLAVQRFISGVCGGDTAIASKMRELDVRLNSLEDRISLLLGRTDRTS
jgi:methylglyoxal synthase